MRKVKSVKTNINVITMRFFSKTCYLRRNKSNKCPKK